MNIEEGLYSYLSGVAGLTALISNRIYPLVMPQNPTLPAISYQEISRLQPHTMGDDPDLGRPRYQFTIWAASLASARAVAKQLKAALQNQRNQLWGGAGGVTVTVLGPENQQEGYQRLDSGAEIFSISQDYFFWHDSN